MTPEEAKEISDLAEQIDKVLAGHPNDRVLMALLLMTAEMIADAVEKGGVPASKMMKSVVDRMAGLLLDTLKHRKAEAEVRH